MRIVDDIISFHRIANCKYLGMLEGDSIYFLCNRWDDMKQYYIVPAGIKIIREGYENFNVKTFMTKYPTEDSPLADLIRKSWEVVPPKFPWNNGRVYT